MGQATITKPTRRTFETTDDRGCAFDVTRYGEWKGFDSNGEPLTHTLYIAEVGGVHLRAKSLAEIKTLAAAVG